MVDTELTNHTPPLDTETAIMEEYEQATNAAKGDYLAVVFFSGSAEHQNAQTMRDLKTITSEAINVRT